MIPSKRKVGSGLFDDVWKRGRSYHGEAFSVRILIEGGAKAKISVVVSKKVEKTAVKRNLIKRRVYSAIREILPEIKAGVIVTVSVKKDHILKDKIKPELIFLLKKAGAVA